MPCLQYSTLSEVAADVAGLRAALDAMVSSREVDRNLLFATWSRGTSEI